MIDAIVLVAALAVRAPQPDGTSARAEEGKRLYTTYYCYACHGTLGQGGAGPRLIVAESPTPMIRFVRKPTGTMPPYTSRVISNQDLAHIHAYLKSIPPSLPAKSIPLLNQ